MASAGRHTPLRLAALDHESRSAMTTQSNYAAPADGTAAGPGVSARDRRADAQVLASLQAADPNRAILITGGTLLTQDPAAGDRTTGDILVRDGKIAAIGADLSASAGDGAVTIDASDAIVLPGFVDSHVHAWEGQLRGTAPTLDFGAYLGFTAFGYGPHYRPTTTTRAPWRPRSSL